MTFDLGADVRRRIGDVGQIASARPVRLADGAEDGVRAIDVRTIDGLHAPVLVDRGLDIGPAWYRGTPVAWTSGTGFTHPAYHETQAWLRSFGGGLLVTCGLQNVGSPGVEDGVHHGLHGRISNTPARNVAWESSSPRGGRSHIIVTGAVRETTVGGSDLELRRTIRFAVGEPAVRIEDEVVNLGHTSAPLMILYHFNIGFPIVDEPAFVVSSADRVSRRHTDEDLPAPESRRIGAPRQDPTESVLEHHHDRSSGRAAIGVVNEERDLGVCVDYRLDQLPRLWEWRSVAPGLYLVGLEPANCGIDGRVAERAAGRLDVLRPGARRRFILRVVCGSASGIRGIVSKRASDA